MGGEVLALFSAGQVRMKPGSLLLAFLLTGLVAGEDYDDSDYDYESRKGGKGAGVKGECKRTGPKPSDKIFAPYTIPIKNKKCPCWWDMSKKICACCKKVEGVEVMQCGFPMHKFCYKKSTNPKKVIGCPGVCNNKYTLSGKGFPCYNDKSKGNNCAVCAKGAFQCYADGITGPDSKDGSRCQDQKNQKYCTSCQGDCRHIPGACPGRCVNQGKVNKFTKHSQCVCPEGYSGNGIQCYNANGTLLADPNTHVELTMDITTEEDEFPFTGENFSSSAELQTLITEMGSVESGCNGGDCEATFTQTETET